MAEVAPTERIDVDRIPTRSLRATASGPSPLGRTGITIELGVGALLLALAALAGLAFVHRPWPNRLDIWGDRLLPADLSSRWAHELRQSRLPQRPHRGRGSRVLHQRVAGLGAGHRMCDGPGDSGAHRPGNRQAAGRPAQRSHRQSLLSVGDRCRRGCIGHPLALVVPAKVRIPMALVGLFAIVGTCAAVIVLRWHYPTDAIGGVAVGVGSVLVVDALLHVPKAIATVSSSAPRGRVGWPSLGSTSRGCSTAPPC